MIDSWEAENFKNSTESGLLITSDGKIIDFGGTDHHVTGRADDIRLMDGAVFTHNHPTNNTFSQNDIVTGLVKGNLKELRAVTSTGDIHILVNNGAAEEQRKKFSAAYQQRRMKAANAADSKIRKGEKINKEEYIRKRLETFMSENAKDYNLKYVKSHVENNGRPLANSGESGIIKAGGNNRSRNKRLEDVIHKSIENDDSIFADGLLGKNAKSIIPKQGYYDLVAHGTPNTAQLFGVDVTPEILANVLKARIDYPRGAPIRLISCKTGVTDSKGLCFAQRLADILNVEVLAPTENIWVFPSGRFSVGTRFNSHDGRMKAFKPRRRE